MPTSFPAKYPFKLNNKNNNIIIMNDPDSIITSPSPSASTNSFIPASPHKIARVGICSTAKVNRHIITAAISSSVAKIVAIASRSQDKADQYAKENNIPRSFGSYEAMCQSDEVDIIYVSVPNELHKTVTMLALRNKKHVLCEKPLTLTKADALQMFDCAAENGVLLAEASMNLHSGVVKKAQEIVQSGKIGKLISMRGNFCIFGGPSSSGGALYGLGSILINMSRFISGCEPTHVSCHCVKSWLQSSDDESKKDEKKDNHSNHLFHQRPPSHIGVSIDESKLELNDDAAIVAVAKYPTFLLTFEASSGGPQSTSFEILGDKGTITFETPFRPKPEAASLFVRYEKNPIEEIVVSDKQIHGDIEHLYQMELDEIARLSFKVPNTNKVHHEQQQQASMMMNMNLRQSSKSACGDDDGTDRDQKDHHIHNQNTNNSTSSSMMSPSDIVGQLILPEFSISGACVLEMMQRSMQQGGVMLATNLQQPKRKQ